MQPLSSRTPVQPTAAALALEGVPTVVILRADPWPESPAVAVARADVRAGMPPVAIPDEHFSCHRFVVSRTNQHALANRFVVPAAAPMAAFAEVQVQRELADV